MQAIFAISGNVVKQSIAFCLVSWYGFIKEKMMLTKVTAEHYCAFMRELADEIEDPYVTAKMQTETQKKEFRQERARKLRKISVELLIHAKQL